jgi:hypothetical protein
LCMIVFPAAVSFRKIATAPALSPTKSMRNVVACFRLSDCSFSLRYAESSFHLFAVVQGRIS